jgi:hypothetical protein
MIDRKIDRFNECHNITSNKLWAPGKTVVLLSVQGACTVIYVHLYQEGVTSVMKNLIGNLVV